MSYENNPVMKQLVERFRYKILDLDPLENILKGDVEFDDKRIEHFIIEALHDINETEPRTNISLQKFNRTGLLLDGAVIQMLKGRGLLHVRNQVSYNDAGFSVNVDDKSGYYAQWLGQLSADYMQKRKEFKMSMVPRFRGVDSPYRIWR